MRLLPHARPTRHLDLGDQGSLLVSALALALALSSCKSPAQYAREADREVYEIIRERRDELAAGGSFTLEVDEPTLRQELLAGEVELEALDLFDCLRVAAENNRGYRSQREALYLRALDLTLERWRFSVQESGTFGAFLAGRGGPGGQTQTAGLLSNLGLSKLLGTGMRIAGGLSIDLVRTISRGDGWDALSNLSLDVTQPLLRGFGESIVLEPLTQAERNVLYQARAYERFRRTFAFEVAARFFRVLEQESVVENELQNEENLIRLRLRNEAFAEAGRLTDIEVDQARQNELGARNRVIEAERSLAAARDEFLLFLGLPIGGEGGELRLDPDDLLSLEAWEDLSLDLNEEDVIEIGLERRLDHLTRLDLVTDAARKVEVAADALRAGLDLAASVRGSSPEGQPAQFRTENVDWDLTLTFDAPFERLPERNEYRARMLALEEARRNAEESADTIRSDLRDALRRLETARQALEIQTRAVSLAERRVESAELNLEAGRASTRDVLEATEDLVQNRNGATGALTDYILIGLGLYRDLELLRVDDGRIDVDVEPFTGQAEVSP